MRIDHDQLFKKIIEAFFWEFMELFCPAEAARIDFTRVEFLREEFFTDVRRGKHRRLDLVVKVGLKAGGTKYVLVHFEFEASRKDENFPRRMFKYFCQLFLRHELDIVPVAVFTDDAEWKMPVPDFFEIKVPGKTVVRFEFHLIKLKHLDYRLFLQSNNPLAYALMAKMNYNRPQRARLKADFLRLILGARIDPARESLLVDFVDTYMPLAPREKAELQQTLAGSEEFQEVRKMMTSWEKDGVKKGRKQGMKQGRAKGKQELLLLQLESTFGRLPEDVACRIREISSESKLESLALSVMKARSLAELDI